MHAVLKACVMLSAGVVLIGSLNAAFATSFEEQQSRCNYTKDRQEQIAGCTTIIRSGRLASKDLAAAFYNRGLGYEALSDFNNALKNYEAAVSLDGQKYLYLYARAFAYQAVGAYDRALADYHELVRRAPRNFTLYAHLAETYLAKGDFKSAEDSASKAIEEDSSSARLFTLRAGIEFKAGSFWSAVSDLDRALARDPHNAVALELRGQVFEALGKPEKAISDFRSALLNDPSLELSKKALERLDPPESLGSIVGKAFWVLWLLFLALPSILGWLNDSSRSVSR